MYYDSKLWIANDDNGGHLEMLPKMANRHGLIAGATGTGKTVTLKVMAESFSDMGVPVFMADVKGDLAGTAFEGVDSDNMRKRIERFGLADTGFSYHGYPCTFWDIYGENGIPLRTTISEMGPLLLARILDLNELQSDILSIIFRIADENDLLLVDIKDLKSMINYVNDNRKDYEEDFGRISPASVGAILRAVAALETQGGDRFFGEPALNISDWITLSPEGKGMINILDSESLINNGRLYSTFLLWLMSKLFDTMPEVGDMAKPKMIFFFDEAHLLFDGAPKVLLDKIEQVVKLIRSKGVGIYFVTQNPKDIPDGVLAQLGNKVQHALRAYTPADQKNVKAAAASFRVNPDLDTYNTLISLGTGEAIVSFLDEGGIPTMVQKAYILPPMSRMSSISESERESCIKNSILYSRYAEGYDPESAYEVLQKRADKAAEEAELLAQEAAAAKAELEAQKAADKEAAAKEKAAQKQAEKDAKARKQAIKNVASSATGTVGRELGKALGGKFGSFGKTLGGNLGASLGRNILGTLFKTK